jgi:hypothetical protein
MRFVFGTACAAVACVLLAGAGAYQAGEKKDPKYTIKDVMKLAHKEGLLKKVISGKADEGERKELAELYLSLTQNKPPMGDADDWRKTTDRMVAAARAAAKGDPAAPKLLKQAVNCGGCHNKFKG